MRRIFNLLLLAFSTSICLFGCGKNKPSPTPPQSKYSFDFIGTNCRINSKNQYHEEIDANSDRIYTISIDINYSLLPSDVEITGVGATYDPLEGQIKISKIANNISIKATAKLGHSIIFYGENCSIEGTKNFYFTLPDGYTHNYPITLDDESYYLFKNDVEIKGGGDAVTFNETDNSININNLKASVRIIAIASKPNIVSFTGTNCKGKVEGMSDFQESFIYKRHKSIKTSIKVFFEANENYQLPIEMTIKFDGLEGVRGRDYLYIRGNSYLLIYRIAKSISIKSIAVKKDISLIFVINASKDAEFILPETFSKNTIDWGDGSTTKNVPRHIYAKDGEYEIKILGRVDSFTFSENENIEKVFIYLIDGTLNEGTFVGCKKLNTAFISNAIFKLPKSIFNGCSSLKYVSITDAIQTIDESAFQNCLELEKIYIPFSTTTIGENAFNGCSKLKEVYLTSFDKDSIIPTISINTFSENVTKFYVSSEEIKDRFLQQPIWKDLANKFSVLTIPTLQIN